VAPAEYVQKDASKFWTAENCGHLSKLRSHIAAYKGEWEVAAIAESIENYIRSNQWPLGKVMNSLRLSLTGSASGLGIAEIIYTIGLQETVRRIDHAFKTLGT
jgi:glutamyl-tRNA synthetase